MHSFIGQSHFPLESGNNICMYEMNIVYNQKFRYNFYYYK